MVSGAFWTVLIMVKCLAVTGIVRKRGSRGSKGRRGGDSPSQTPGVPLFPSGPRAFTVHPATHSEHISLLRKTLPKGPWGHATNAKMDSSRGEGLAPLGFGIPGTQAKQLIVTETC